MRAKFLIIALSTLCAGFGQRQAGIDFREASANIEIHPLQEVIMGEVEYSFDVLAKVDSVFLDARNMEISKVQLNGRKTRFYNTGRYLVLKKKFKKGKSGVLQITYRVKPEQAVYFLGWKDSIPDNEQIWTQGQGKNNSHWIPSFDEMSEKVTFDLTLSAPKGYEVIANGKLEARKDDEQVSTWIFDMDKPMSSYLLAFAIGKYQGVKRSTASGIPLHMYYYPQDHDKQEPTYRYTREIFDFLEQEIGVRYPWQNYKQIPVRDFLYAGMENTGTTIFSDAFVVDSTAFKDRNYVNVNAHELAHQWFGNLVTEESPAHHWLHEGLSSYYALLSEKGIFGDEHFYWMVYEKARMLQTISAQGEGESLIDPGASSSTFYDKGALAALMLRERVGDSLFRAGIRQFLTTHAYGTAQVADLLDAFDGASKNTIEEFNDTWLKNSAFPFDEVREYLIRSSGDFKIFFRLREALIAEPKSDEDLIRKAWREIRSDYIKSAVIRTYLGSLSENFISDILGSGSWKVRQAVIRSVSSIPPGLKSSFESLLDDPSYVTKERALYLLWLQFPEDRVGYLEKTANIFGLPNGNVRILWLLLARLTPAFGDAADKADYEAALRRFTAPHYTFEIRQQAFMYLNDVLGLDDKNLEDLIYASSHHNWQFRSFARKLLDRLWLDENIKKLLRSAAVKLNPADARYVLDKSD